MKLALFFTRSVSLQLWNDKGLLSREKCIYERLLSEGVCGTVFWFTYGSKDLVLAGLLQQKGELAEGIKVIPKPYWLPSKIGDLVYSFLLPFLQKRFLQECDIFKTNQLDGSWAAVLAKKVHAKPLIVRCGYIWSLFSKEARKKFKLDFLSRAVEKYAYRECDYGVVASESDKKYVIETYAAAHQRIFVIPNFVNTDKFFSFRSLRERKERFLFVGRLVEQKNLLALVGLFKGSQFGLDIFGDGEMKGQIEGEVSRIGVDVKLKGIVSHEQLPDVFNSYKYFILPSLYEGTPKSLLEAMACGCICFGTDVAGIKPIISHQLNGFLLQSVDRNEVFSLLKGITSAEFDLISYKAIQTIKSQYSFEHIIDLEKNILKTCGCATKGKL